MSKFTITELNDAQTAALVKVFGCTPADLTGEVSLVTRGEARVQRACACGCGRATYGTWFPGDDSIYKAGLLAVSRGKRTPEPGIWDTLTPEQALTELRRLEADAAARKAAKAKK